MGFSTFLPADCLFHNVKGVRAADEKKRKKKIGEQGVVERRYRVNGHTKIRYLPKVPR